MPSPRKRHAQQLFRGLPDHYDRVGSLMSFGQDPRWRRVLVDALAPRPGMRILDVATGTGMVAFALAARGATVVGLDQNEAMLDRARTRLRGTPEMADRLSFTLGEAETLPFADGEFDALSFTYLLRYVDDPAATMRELIRVVKPGDGLGCLSSECRATPGCADCGVFTPALGCRCLVAWCQRTGMTSAGSWVPTSSSSMPRSRIFRRCGATLGSPRSPNAS